MTRLLLFGFRFFAAGAYALIALALIAVAPLTGPAAPVTTVSGWACGIFALRFAILALAPDLDDED
jgi:hypothetical protein